MGLKGSLETILNNIELAKQNSSIKKEVIVVAASKTRAFSLIEEVYFLPETFEDILSQTRENKVAY